MLTQQQFTHVRARCDSSNNANGPTVWLHVAKLGENAVEVEYDNCCGPKNLV